MAPSQSSSGVSDLDVTGLTLGGEGVFDTDCVSHIISPALPLFRVLIGVFGIDAGDRKGNEENKSHGVKRVTFALPL